MKNAIKFAGMFLAVVLGICLIQESNRPVSARDAYPGGCNYHKYIHTTSATDTTLVALVAGQQVFVCDWEVSAGATDVVYLESSTSATCASAFTQLTGAWYLGANTNGKTAGNSQWRGVVTPVGTSLCANTSTTGPADFSIFYDQR